MNHLSIWRPSSVAKLVFLCLTCHDPHLVRYGSACTKASVIDHVLIYGGAKYQETGRGFVIERATLKDIWMCFYFTHFSIGLEMILLLAIYAIVSNVSPTKIRITVMHCVAKREI